MDVLFSIFIFLGGSVGVAYFTKSAWLLVRQIELELSTEDLPRSIIHGIEVSPWNFYIAIIRVRPEWESSDYPRLKNLVDQYRMQVVRGLLCLGGTVGVFLLAVIRN